MLTWRIDHVNVIHSFGKHIRYIRWGMARGKDTTLVMKCKSTTKTLLNFCINAKESLKALDSRSVSKSRWVCWGGSRQMCRWRASCWLIKAQDFLFHWRKILPWNQNIQSQDDPKIRSIWYTTLWPCFWWQQHIPYCRWHRWQIKVLKIKYFYQLSMKHVMTVI